MNLGSNEDNVRVIINSAHRVVPADPSHNFTYTLNKSIDRVYAIDIASVQIPFSYYAINDNNNKLTVTAGTATLINGNYTSSTFPSMVQTALNILLGGHVVKYSAITGRITITHAASIILTVGGVNDASRLLGFTATSANAVSITGDATALFTGPNYIIIKSSVLTRFNASATATSLALATSSIMHTIPVNVNAGSVIFDTPSHNSALIWLNARDSFKSLIDFQLEDDQGNALNLNGANWSMQLRMMTK